MPVQQQRRGKSTIHVGGRVQKELAIEYDPEKVTLEQIRKAFTESRET